MIRCDFDDLSSRRQIKVLRTTASHLRAGVHPCEPEYRDALIAMCESYAERIEAGENPFEEEEKIIAAASMIELLHQENAATLGELIARYGVVPEEETQ